MAGRPGRAILFREMVVGTHTKRHTPRTLCRRCAIEGLGTRRHVHILLSHPFPSAAPEPSPETTPEAPADGPGARVG